MGPNSKAMVQPSNFKSRHLLDNFYPVHAMQVAGLITTLSSIIWGPIQNGRKKIEGVTGYDFLFPVMNNFLPASSNCSNVPARSSERHTACFMIDGSGLLLIHSDFLLSAAEKEKIQDSVGNKDVGNGLLRMFSLESRSPIWQMRLFAPT